MTPKEKAVELINRHIDASVVVVGSEEYYHEKPFTLAKQCALIAVDFALEYVDGTLDEMFDKILYLTEVKNEIEKL